VIETTVETSLTEDRTGIAHFTVEFTLDEDVTGHQAAMAVAMAKQHILDAHRIAESWNVTAPDTCAELDPSE